jgi:hypothetical protein
MLQRTWQEIEYRLDVRRATIGAHLEVSSMRQRKLTYIRFIL